MTVTNSNDEHKINEDFFYDVYEIFFGCDGSMLPGILEWCQDYQDYNSTDTDYTGSSYSDYGRKRRSSDSSYDGYDGNDYGATDNNCTSQVPTTICLDEHQISFNEKQWSNIQKMRENSRKKTIFMITDDLFDKSWENNPERSDVRLINELNNNYGNGYSIQMISTFSDQIVKKLKTKIQPFTIPHRIVNRDYFTEIKRSICQV